ncbi:MAG TPA: endo-1,4-D-glucanase, partial [Enterobacter asburiae]|nr:endo-1,4-D-glucanase [Enterobacter asburiae]
MKAFRWCALAALMLAALPLRAACTWPAWEQFKKDYISEGGRVVDPSDTRKITTSEGQSYALFFALAANDRSAFDQLLTWTRDNLASGNLNDHLPAWLWGQKDKETWAVIDTNSASDADVWIAWSLLEAGRLWKHPDYTRTGKALLKRIISEEVVKV